jgi:hypothetical protein
LYSDRKVEMKLPVRGVINQSLGISQGNFRQRILENLDPGGSL